MCFLLKYNIPFFGHIVNVFCAKFIKKLKKEGMDVKNVKDFTNHGKGINFIQIDHNE